MKTQQLLNLWAISEVSLIYKTRIPASERKKLCSSKEAYDLFLQNWNPETLEYYEEFKILLLNRSNAVLGLFTVSSGGVSGTVIDVKMIFQAALKANASGLVAAHNHPSGNLNPSDADKSITRKIADAGKILDIAVLDHIIITPTGYHSFADNGLL